jgi:transglutaminase-like putative cysteine protease
MPLLTIHHNTEYRYAHPVSFGEHRLMLRPHEGHDLRLLDGELRITPEPASLRWIHDIFGNTVAIAMFDQLAERLTFTSVVTVEHNPVEEIMPGVDDAAYYYPFAYDVDELRDLEPFMTPQYNDKDGELMAWALQRLSGDGRTRTHDLLRATTLGIRESFTYRRRYEHGTQHPLDTLQTKSGTCRDFALFMIEALRRLGIAARFVSGYIFIPRDCESVHVGGGSTHAWVQAYLPNSGWIEFDPTNGILGSRDLIRIAVARDPRQALPLHGTYTGTPDAFREMHVSINVTSPTKTKDLISC